MTMWCRSEVCRSRLQQEFADSHGSRSGAVARFFCSKQEQEPERPTKLLVAFKQLDYLVFYKHELEIYIPVPKLGQQKFFETSSQQNIEKTRAERVRIKAF